MGRRFIGYLLDFLVSRRLPSKTYGNQYGKRREAAPNARTKKTLETCFSDPPEKHFSESDQTSNKKDGQIILYIQFAHALQLCLEED